MLIRVRNVKNKKQPNGLPSGKAGVVNDAFLKYKMRKGFKFYYQHGFLTKSEMIRHKENWIF